MTTALTTHNETRAAELRQQLQLAVGALMGHLVEGVKRIAPLVLEMDRIGADYSGFESCGAIIDVARRVAHGMLLPELLNLQGSPIFKHAEQMPAAAQLSVVKDELVQVINLTNGRADKTPRRTPFSSLSTKEMRIVMGPNGVRTLEQQTTEWNKMAQARPATVRVDAENGKITLHGEYTKADLKKFLRMME